jgi:hypothetical protein
MYFAETPNISWTARVITGRYLDRLERCDLKRKIALRRSTVELLFTADASLLQTESSSTRVIREALVTAATCRTSGHSRSTPRHLGPSPATHREVGKGFLIASDIDSLGDTDRFVGLIEHGADMAPRSSGSGWRRFSVLPFSPANG